MRRRRLLWQLYPSYLVVVLLTLIAITWYVDRSLRAFYLAEVSNDLEVRARLVRSRLTGVPLDEVDRVDALCKTIGRESRSRVTLILPDGTVIGDSDNDPSRMENHADRPEIQVAMSGHVGTSQRYSATLKQRMLYVAIPVSEGVSTTLVVRTSVALTAVNAALNAVYRDIALGGFLVILVAAGIGFVMARRITRPLEQLRAGVERYARGELNTNLPVPASVEFAALAEAMNRMREQLKERMQAVIEQRNQEEAILESMVEGVMAIDSDERLLMVNSAAAHLFDIEGVDVSGKPLQEVVRNNTIQELAAKTLESNQPVEREISLYEKEERILQVHGTSLLDSANEKIGVLLVLNDITSLRKLERVRRDFVANVSHELRTPVTTIKGFVETLLSGALKSDEDAERFLVIVARHTDRLNAIIEDLLSLSRIEQQADKAEIPLERTLVSDVIRRAVEFCNERALDRNIQLSMNGTSSIECMLNAQLVEQALVNLIDNAIKYSEDGGRVEVKTTRKNGEVEISVKDEGCGIDPEHVPRLFERFYRTDQARSRTLGGTGLGLSIVKHIAIAHGGHVGVESTPGKGSVFSICLPIDKSA